MEIEDWPSAKTLPALYRELKQLGLLEHVAELEAFGFTVLPPEKVGPPQQHEAVRDALLGVACERKSCSQAELPGVFSDDQELLRFMLWDDPLFEKIVVNPAALGLVEYLLGSQCILSLCDGWVKGAGEARTGVHCDWAQFEMPTFPPEPYTANFNYLLSDYTKEDGALGFVPGSHRWRRWPSPEEAEYWNDRCHPIEAPFGSMIVWGDHTWHGSYPRRTEGLRLMMLGTFCRPHMQTQEPFRQTVAQAALDRNPLRFARLMDVRGAFPFGKSPPRPRKSKDGASSVGPAALAGHLSLLDDEPAAGRVALRQEVDFGHYDAEFAEAMAKDKPKAIRFPDLYRAPPRKPAA